MNTTEQKEKAYQLQLMGKHIEARTIYKNIVTDHTEDFELLIRYADCLDDEDPKKIHLYKKALQIGNTPWACFGLCRVFLNQKKISLATHYIHQAYEICLSTEWTTCQTTLETIQDLQNQISKIQEKCIFVKVKNGLANRLRTINSFMNLAEHTGAKLFICWDKGQGWSDELFEDLFSDVDSIKFIDTHTYDNLTQNIPALHDMIYKNEEDGNYYVMKKPLGEVIDVLKGSFCYYGDSCLEYMLPSLFEYSNALFKLLEPKKQLMDTINKVSSSFDEHTIGLHIRRGDAWTSPWKQYFQESKTELFIEAIKDELQQNYKAKFFLSTDSIEINELFTRLFKDKIIFNTNKQFFNSNNIYDNKPYQADAVIDMFLLSKTKKIIGTNWSSFSIVSSQIGDTELHIAKTTEPPEYIGLSKSVSLICAVKNRLPALLVSLHSWLLFKEIYEIIIVDWSSDENLSFLSKLDDRIKVIRVDGQKYFHLSKAYNLAIKNATCDLILKMDCDYMLNPYYNFFDIHPLERNEFLTGAFQDKLLDNKMGFLEYLNGFIYIHRDQLNKIHGYNENLQNYGYDDTDLYNRLIQHGCDRVYLNHRELSVFHIPHSDYTRYENYQCKNITLSSNQNAKISEGTKDKDT